jgi:hypothetical protein
MIKSSFSADLLSRAFRASNGELAWTKSDAIQAARELVAGGIAVLGGEVWLIMEQGRWDGLIPQANGTVPGVYTWEPRPASWQASETWNDYCVRMCDYTGSVLERLSAETDVVPTLRPRIRYNLTYVSREEYEALAHKR